MGYDINKTGFLSAAPYLAMGILLLVAGYMADMFQLKGWLTTTQVNSCEVFFTFTTCKKFPNFILKGTEIL